MIALPAEISPDLQRTSENWLLRRPTRRGFSTSSGDASVPLLGFADRPFDSRTASVAAEFSWQHVEPSSIAALLPLGAPIVFACLPQRFEFWSQGVSRPSFPERLEPEAVPQFFNENRASLAPTRLSGEGLGQD